MIKIHILAVFLTFSGFLFSQKEFAPIGATWYYSKHETWRGDYGYVKIVSEMDTIIAGKTCRKLSQKYFSGQDYYIEEYGGVVNRDDIYVHQSGDTVFIWLNDGFRVWYNFSLAIGDTMKIYSETIFCFLEDGHFGNVEVVDVSDMIINKDTLRKISTTPLKGSPYQYPGPFVEVIGGIYGVFPVDTGCLMDAFPEIGNLRCYNDDNIGEYKVSESMACDSLIVSIKPARNNTNINLYFNQNNKTIRTIPELELAGNTKINLLDITGRKILEHNIKDSYVELFIPYKIRDGIYIVSVFNERQKINIYEKIYIY